MRNESLQKIEEILKQEFQPLSLKVEDDSARHKGHAGAMQNGGKAGGTHFKVEIVAEAFEGKSLLERHRAVKDALKDLFGSGMHALQLKTLSPSEEK